MAEEYFPKVPPPEGGQFGAEMRQAGDGPNQVGMAGILPELLQIQGRPHLSGAAGFDPLDRVVRFIARSHVLWAEILYE